MAVKLGNGNWAVKEDKLLAYNDNSGRFFNKEFDFARGSSATYVGKDGLIKSAASGVPRIDFSDSSSGALLLEPQSTNLIEYSEDFSDSYWSKTGAIVISDAAVSPNGTLNADKLNFTASNGEIVKGMTFISGQTYTMSFYAKTESGTLDFIYGNMDYSTISGTATNEWQRFVITQTLPTATRFPKIQTTEIGSLLLWGWQVEQQSFATSYIPSLSGSATTRSADVCNNSGSAQDFNSEEGVLYFEGKSLIASLSYNYFLALSDGTNSNRLELRQSGTALQFLWRIGGVYQGQILSSGLTITNNMKFALKYSSTEIAFWINGAEMTGTIATPTLFPANTLTELAFDDGSGVNPFQGKCKDLQVFTTALTDEQLAALTTI